MVKFYYFKGETEKMAMRRYFGRRILAVTVLIVMMMTTISMTTGTPIKVRDEQVMGNQIANAESEYEQFQNIQIVEPDPIPEPSEFTADTDLKQFNRVVTVDQMEYLIEVYTKNYPDSAFKGTEYAFFQAEAETGYNPIFLFALAGLESGWNTAYIHRTLNNPYSLGMVDGNIWNGMNLGDTFYDGIVSGAHIINDTWYAQGRITLNQMQEPPMFYASDNEWATIIVDVVNECYDILDTLNNGG